MGGYFPDLKQGLFSALFKISIITDVSYTSLSTFYSKHIFYFKFRVLGFTYDKKIYNLNSCLDDKDCSGVQFI